MIADWTVEIGPGCPVIELPWPGWVDLCAGSPQASAAGLTEVQAYPELAGLLCSANQGKFATAKVDVFPVDRSEADPEIAEHPAERTACGIGSYLDLVWLGEGVEPPFSAFEVVARAVSGLLGDVSLPLGTAEIVVRAAHLYHQEVSRDTFGWTLYAVGFGPDVAAARLHWGRAADAVVAAFRATVDTPLWASSSIG
jgi:hypothetical protein